MSMLTWQELLQGDGWSLQQSLFLQVVHSACKELDREVLPPVGSAVCAAQHIGWARPSMRLHAVLALEAHTLLHAGFYRSCAVISAAVACTQGRK